MKCSICCCENEIVVKIPPICKKCYTKQYQRKHGRCKNCGFIKELHTKELCDSCYRKSYQQIKKVCCICKNVCIIKQNTERGPICKKCYINKDFCYVCHKYREVCTRINNNAMCRCCYNKIKCKTDIQFNIINRLRQRLSAALKNYSLNGKVKTSDEYGINYYKIIKKLEPFPENIEDYNIDHIFPLSAFDFNNYLHIRAAFDPENHQWLKKQENFTKNNKYNKERFLVYLDKKIKEYMS